MLSVMYFQPTCMNAHYLAQWSKPKSHWQFKRSARSKEKVGNKDHTLQYHCRPYAYSYGFPAHLHGHTLPGSVVRTKVQMAIQMKCCQKVLTHYAPELGNGFSDLQEKTLQFLSDEEANQYAVFARFHHLNVTCVYVLQNRLDIQTNPSSQ